MRRLPEDGSGRKGGKPAAPAGGEAWPSEGRIAFHETTAAYDWSADPAVARVCLDIPAGSSCVLMGHSGSGKSTLVLALTGLIPVLSGAMLCAQMQLELAGGGRCWPQCHVA